MRQDIPLSVRTRLESPSNTVFKKFLSLTTSKGLKAEGLFILSGKKLIEEFLKAPNLEIDAEALPEGAENISTARSVFELTASLFQQLDVLGTHAPLLILKQPPMINLDLSQPPKGLEVVCPLGDPGNLGAIVRSAEAFGVSQVILTKEAAHPFLPKSVKASAGSVLRVPILRADSLSDLSGDLIALDQKGESLQEFNWPPDCRLLVGEEGMGIRGMKFRHTLSIPTQGVESLNAVVAASLAFYHHAQNTRKATRF
jgi:RNA methyltransferase, TrmH family